MKKYFVVSPSTNQRVEFDDLKSAAKCFSDIVEQGQECHLVMSEERVIGSFRN